MDRRDFERIQRIRQYCLDIGETANKDIPLLLQFCEKIIDPFYNESSTDFWNNPEDEVWDNV